MATAAPRKAKPPTFRTGISGLDELLRGGMVLPESQKLTILISGPPGSGKTTLAMHLAKAALHWKCDCPQTDIRYLSCEQDDVDVAASLRRLGVPEASIVCESGTDSGGSVPAAARTGSKPANPAVRVGLPPTEPQRRCEEGFPSGRSALAFSSEARRWVTEYSCAQEHRLIVVDGLNLLHTGDRGAAEVDGLVSALRDRSVVSVVVYESGEEAERMLAYQCDIIIRLLPRVTAGPERYQLHNLVIEKTRYQRGAFGWHQYKMGDKGIEVLPSIHFRLSECTPLGDRYTESLQSIAARDRKRGRLGRRPLRGDRSLVGEILGARNLLEGSITVLLGPRRTYKTQLTFDFLRSGHWCDPGQAGLLLSLIDNAGTISKERKDLCRLRRLCADDAGTQCVRSRNCYEHVYLLHAPTGCFTTSSLLDWIERRLREQERWVSESRGACGEEKPREPARPIGRLVFWDLAQLPAKFPLLHGDPLLLPGLMDYLKDSPKTDGAVHTGKGRRRITSLFMGPSVGELASTASALADNVLFSWPAKWRPSSRRKGHEEDGVAIYVDRIEGRPGEKRLRFIRRVREREGGQPRAGGLEVVRPDSEDHVPGAAEMIEAIHQLQGLRPVPRRGPDSG